MMQDILTTIRERASDVVLRPYAVQDEQQVVDLWNLCLDRDKVTLTTFRQKVILDVNFDPAGCFVAEEQGRVVGFMLSIRRRYPYFDVGLEPRKGWITVFFVHPDLHHRSIGSTLMAAAEDFLVRAGVTEVSVSDYTPNYFIPGIDVDAYADGYEFLRACGFERASNVYSMGRSLVDFSVPPEMAERFEGLERSGFRVSVFRPADTLNLLEFLRQNYPGDLFRVAHQRILDDPECDEILVAVKGDKVIGFSHFMEERFGPFGISPEHTGRGLGPMLYYRTVEHMRKKGRHNLWLAWTSGRAKDFYHKVGLKVLRRHVVMRKALALRGKNGS